MLHVMMLESRGTLLLYYSLVAVTMHPRLLRGDRDRQTHFMEWRSVVWGIYFRILVLYRVSNQRCVRRIKRARRVWSA